MDTLVPSPPIDVLIAEVGMRDGLQAVKRTMSTDDKIAWLHALVGAGVREIEVASFVPAKRLPQMADAAQITSVAAGIKGLSVVALVPNLRGTQAAIAAGAHKITVPCSASAAHTHNTRGLGIANCLAAYDVGIRSFDSSMAGLGGCPLARAAIERGLPSEPLYGHIAQAGLGLTFHYA